MLSWMLSGKLQPVWVLTPVVLKYPQILLEWVLFGLLASVGVLGV